MLHLHLLQIVVISVLLLLVGICIYCEGRQNGYRQGWHACMDIKTHVNENGVPDPPLDHLGMP